MTFDLETLSKSLIAIKGRAERLDEDTIVESFASVGPLEHVISNEDHQVIYGRRGTGKTHALRFLSNKAADQGGVSFFVDMTSLGSDSSIYNDTSLPLAERTTRLLIDVLNSLSESVIEHATSRQSMFSSNQLGRLMEILDEYSASVSQVRIEGDKEVTLTRESNSTSKKTSGYGAKVNSTKSFVFSADSASERQTGQIENVVEKEIGQERYILRFPNLSKSVRTLFDFFGERRVWILLDEWSSLPLDLQPFLADMLRRSFFNIQNVTVKIAAIEHRTKFVNHVDSSNYIGLEPTADIKTNLKLDDYLLFDNDSERPVSFFREFLYKHVVSVCREKGWPEPNKPQDVIDLGFSQKNAFNEFVKATEGVPRDAIHIISNSAQKAFGRTIDIPTIRQTAHRYYQEDKSSQVDENPVLRELLRFIIEDAIRAKRTNSFLLAVNKSDEYVDMLFDRRLVHIRSRNVSSRDNPGERYFHYKLDYGCYIDLVATKQMPSEHDFSKSVNIDDLVAMTEVPEDDDGRSYRRSILDLDKFYREVG